MIHYLTYAMEKKLNLTSLFMIVFLSIKIHPITNIYIGITNFCNGTRLKQQKF